MPATQIEERCIDIENQLIENLSCEVELLVAAKSWNSLPDVQRIQGEKKIPTGHGK